MDITILINILLIIKRNIVNNLLYSIKIIFSVDQLQECIKGFIENRFGSFMDINQENTKFNLLLK